MSFFSLLFLGILLLSLNNLYFCCSLAERAILYELANQSSMQADKLTFDPATPFKEMENNRAQMRGLVLLYHSLTLSLTTMHTTRTTGNNDGPLHFKHEQR